MFSRDILFYLYVNSVIYWHDLMVVQELQTEVSNRLKFVN